jgi:hypothetical protein
MFKNQKRKFLKYTLLFSLLSPFAFFAKLNSKELNKIKKKKLIWYFNNEDK